MLMVENRVGVSIRRKRQYPHRSLRQEYTWDFENRLTQAVIPAAGPRRSGTIRSDAASRNLARSEPRITSMTGGGENVIEEVDKAGTCSPVTLKGPGD